MAIERSSLLGFCCRIGGRCPRVARSYTRHRPPEKLSVNDFIRQINLHLTTAIEVGGIPPKEIDSLAWHALNL